MSTIKLEVDKILKSSTENLENVRRNLNGPEPDVPMIISDVEGVIKHLNRVVSRMTQVRKDMTKKVLDSQANEGDIP